MKTIIHLITYFEKNYDNCIHFELSKFRNLVFSTNKILDMLPFYLYVTLAKYQIFRTFSSGYSVKVCTLAKVQAGLYTSPPYTCKINAFVSSNHPFYILRNML